jgi:hypothetical protein
MKEGKGKLECLLFLTYNEYSNVAADKRLRVDPTYREKRPTHHPECKIEEKNPVYYKL